MKNRMNAKEYLVRGVRGVKKFNSQSTAQIR